MGGVIMPGFELSAKALQTGTAQLPKVDITVPKSPYGANTAEAINAGIYYSALGGLRAVVEEYAKELGRWPQTIVTGSVMEIFKEKCDFVDSWVSGLVIKGIVLAYKKHLDKKAEFEQLGEQESQD